MKNILQYKTVHHQKGSSLIIGLLLLIILSILAVTSMKNVAVEEKMTGNMQDINSAFQGAESGLREAENILGAVSVPDFTVNNNGYYVSTYGANWKTINWTGTAVISSTAFSSAPAPLNKIKSYYYIEELPYVVTPGESLATDSPVDELHYYRITARGVGITGNTVIVLQTTYKR